MAQEIETLYPKAFPYLLRQIPDAPKQLYIKGDPAKTTILTDQVLRMYLLEYP